MARKIIENPNMCSLVFAMNLIGGKWKPIIIYLLANGSMRFGKLLMFIPSISKKVLTDQLKELVEDGLIIREEFKELPPRVEYSLSKKGEGLLPILKSLSEWTVDTFEEEDFEKCRIVTL
ncbi:helix-turn-helix transcriptional regulator [Flammeovirga sp. MY04]|uniref:winged helix-turn-helix transcriptional regulator n=1 Tax=Flammeovirga sp. MY04 TaxID=1191459 RepID=UPI0008060F44|nr:helix-turn-helix domain-containing protein [Flammeovirga sp. MY04]ANQ51171.1 helix-turn-helix transcriptional regulator [Flammeovirga sp. MY04]